MGEVYRARDTRLNRDVALKILPDAFATDPDRVARFQREATTLASLNHPNIAHLHGLEESNGVRALVMELVEGEDLSQRIVRGPIPIDEALPIAKQIAEALEAAHEQGIVHRDLKPANIKLRLDGTVKVLDFGLAKLAHPAATAASANVTASPTITSPAMMTEVGVILGTAAYMAPEQARGREADKRSDIWAFGCVLYEMLTAKRAFEGELISDVLASVLKTDPDWKVLPSETPVALRGLLRRSLGKDPRRRLQAIGEARVQIEELLSGVHEEHGASATASATQRMSHRRVLSIAVASGMVLIVASALTTIWLTRSAPPTRAPVRFTIAPPASQEFARTNTQRDLAVSPDGARLAYIALNRLMVREMNELDAAPLGTGTALRSPFFSPDGRSIGFFTQNADGEIQRASIAGGSPMRVSGYSGVPRGGSWGPDNSIIFATSDLASGLLRVSLSGGEPSVLTTPDTARGELDHLFPSALPNGQAVLFAIQRTGGSLQNADVGVLDLTTGQCKVLIRGSQAAYVESGHLVYAVEGMLNAVRFDLARLEVVGEPLRVIDRMMIGELLSVNYAVSQQGTLVFLPANANSQPELRSLVWVTRDGREEPLTAAGRRPFAAARLSPEGMRVALDVRDPSSDIWILDLARQILTPLTNNPGGDTSPLWMPDGQRIVWASARGNDTTANLFWQAADGTGAAQRLTTSPAVQFPTSVSPDGNRLVMFGNGPSRGRSFGISLVTLSGPLPELAGALLEPKSLLASSADQQDGEISPDGRWIAYQSNESGRFEVWVRPFPDVDAGRVQVSPQGGTRPAWARNARELFYLDADGYLTAVPVQTAGTTFIPGKPTRLFNRRYYAGLSPRGRDLREYDVAHDAQRFLMIKNEGNDDRPDSMASIVVVLNWGEELKRLVPTK